MPKQNIENNEIKKESEITERFVELYRKIAEQHDQIEFLHKQLIRPKPKPFTDEDIFFLERAIKLSIKHAEEQMEKYPQNKDYPNERNACYVILGKIKMMWILTERDKE